jgi:general secretion pathway protein L
MKLTNKFSKLKTFAASSSIGLGKTGRLLRRLLTASLADGTLIPEKSLSVSIGTEGISFCHGSKFLSRVRVSGFGNILPEENRYPDPGVFASAVFSALKDLKVNITDITLSIPKAWVIIQPAGFPLAVKKELSSAVSYELDRLTPFSPENALYDFTIQEENEGGIRLVLFAAKADLLNRYMEALAGKGLRVNRITVNLSGISTLLGHMEKSTDLIFVQTGKYSYEGGLIKKGSVVSGFTGFFGEGEMSGREDAVVKEINTLIAAHGGNGKPLKIIADYVNGAGAVPENKLPVPVQSLRHMDMKLSLAGKNRQDIKKIPGMAAGGMLESLQSRSMKPDLLSKGSHKASATPVALTLVLLAAILAIGLFHVIMPLRMEKERLNEIDRQIMSVKEEAGKVEKLKKEVELLESEIAAIDNFKNNSPMFLSIMKELTTIIPMNAWLTRIKITEAMVEIEGYADTATDIMPKLEASSYFRKAEFTSATTRDPKKNVDRFAIKMEIGGDKDNIKEAVTK